MHVPIQPDAYKDAGIRLFIPANPYKENKYTTLLSSLPELPTNFSTISDINEEMCDWSGIDQLQFNQEFETFESFLSNDESLSPPTLAQLPSTPSIQTLGLAEAFGTVQ